MNKYKIASSAGVDMGIYEGENKSEALDAMTRDAGYRNSEQASGIVGVFSGTVTDIKDIFSDCEDVNDSATEYFNAPCDVDEQGGIWIDGPGAGHWATQQQVSDFAEWILNV